MESLTLFLEFLGDVCVSLGPWNWFVIASALFVLEALLPGAQFYWGSLSACFVGLIAIILENTTPTLSEEFGWKAQLVTFSLISLGAAVFLRKYTQVLGQHSDLSNLNRRGQQCIGQAITIVEPIVSGRGKGQIGDILWIVEGPDAEKGEVMTVVGTNGTVLRVNSTHPQ